MNDVTSLQCGQSDEDGHREYENKETIKDDSVQEDWSIKDYEAGWQVNLPSTTMRTSEGTHHLSYIDAGTLPQQYPARSPTDSS